MNYILSDQKTEEAYTDEQKKMITQWEKENKVKVFEHKKPEDFVSPLRHRFKD